MVEGGDDGSKGGTSGSGLAEPTDAGADQSCEEPTITAEPDAPQPAVRSISGGALMIRPPAQFETILGTADEVTFELPELLDIHDLVRGTTIAGHVLLARHSEDVLGPIYVAYDGTRDRKVALRLIPFDFEDPQSQRQTALVESLTAIGRLSHPCVVPIHAVGMWSGGVYVAMEFVEGIDLRSWIEARDEPFPWREVLRVFREVGRGLVAAHAIGVLHRDLSPDKILIGESGQIHVGDFGLAATTDEPEETAEAMADALQPLRERLGLGSEGSVPPLVGTLEYAPPEVLAGGVADRRSDQFSFCVALYESLYGELPFVGTDRAALAAAYTQGEPRPAPAGARVPAFLRAVVLRGLSIRPADRWPSTERLVRELDRDPAASLRRWQRGLAAVTVVAGVAAVIAWQAHRAASTCARTHEAFNAVWDQTRRAELEQVFVVGGTPYATENFTATAELLDGWTDAWIDEQVALCEARRIGAASEQSYAEKSACLDTRQGELRALLGVLTSADRSALDRASSAVEGLTPIHACTRAVDLAELRHGADADVAKLDETRSQVDRAWVLLRLGRAQAASDVVAPLASESAQELGAPGLHVAALHVRGAIARALGHHAQAEAALHDAAVHATRGGFDHLLVLVWIELAEVLAVVPGRQTEATHLLEQARAVIDRARIDEQRWRLAAARGRVAAGGGRPAEGLPHFHEALEQLDRTIEQPWARMELLLTVGKLIAAGGDDAAALGYLQRAYDAARDRFGARHPVLAEALLEIGDVQARMGDTALARASWGRALGLVTDAHGPSSTTTVTTTLDIAARLREHGDSTSALEYDRRALDAIDRGGSDASLRAMALLDEGRSLLMLARDREAAAPLAQALAIHDTAWRAASKSATYDARRDAAAQLVESTVLLARALSSDPASRERALAHARAAKALAAEHGFEVDPWVLELARGDSTGAGR